MVITKKQKKSLEGSKKPSSATKKQVHEHALQQESSRGGSPGKGKASDDANVPSNIIYIGHIPHGFYEKQMKEFFSQFGQVLNLRLSRNKKTGKSKHYAFLQFVSSEVAEIVAEAMNGYHFFGQKLDVKVLKKCDVHSDIFKGANRTFKRIPWRDIEVKRHNKERTEEEEKKRMKRLSKKNQKRLEKIAASGIEYTYSSHDPVVVIEKKTSGSKRSKTSEDSAKTVEPSKKTRKVATKKTATVAAPAQEKKARAAASVATKKDTVTTAKKVAPQKKAAAPVATKKDTATTAKKVAPKKKAAAPASTEKSPVGRITRSRAKSQSNK
jgi:nucleolar protein 15